MINSFLIFQKTKWFSKFTILTFIFSVIFFTTCCVQNTQQIEGASDPGTSSESEIKISNRSKKVIGSESHNGIKLLVRVSRVHGVAPLSVFFDATGTSGLEDKGFFSNNAAFMDATFSWNFDADDYDPESKYKNTSGFVAAHVFEKPGRYRVRLDVYDAGGKKASTDISINVLPFKGKTYFVAADGSDSNDGQSMATPFKTPQFGLTGPHIQPNTKILFKKGDIFKTSHFWVWDKIGPVIVDSYQDPDDPSDKLPLVFSTEVDKGYATFTLKTDDWRIMNLAARSGGFSYNKGGRYPSGIGITGSNNLKFRTIEYQLGNMAMSPQGLFNTVAECEFYHTNGTGYTSTQNNEINDGGAIIGNWVHDKTGDDEEHVFRLQGGSRYFIGHNKFGPNVKVNYDAITIRGNSEKVVIYKNIVEGWVQDVRPQNKNSAKEYQNFVTLDSNLIYGPGVFPNDRSIAISLNAKDIVIRNNIIVDYQYGIGIDSDRVVGPSQRIKIHNNTFINNSKDDTFTAIYVDDNCHDIDIANNLMLDIAGAKPVRTTFLQIRGNTGIFKGKSDYNIFYGSNWKPEQRLINAFSLSSWQSSSANDLKSMVSDTKLNIESRSLGETGGFLNTDIYRPQKNSPVIDRGITTSNVLDFMGKLRDDSHDIGALEY